ncbi:50S ribosomal protein L11 methyltransferase [Parvularcula lutaonensis]|uniref:50S ribosomal protein L11 methyltransferase n=1 Tax=Parvularcula lutaonensis TaxID=491923 RepID=A0ABV7MBT9_9PROT|nr:50S ribosomal protein L11 methyltransferase [Parvularcula lutaonensis]GGY39594.1 hypothetical protein GCM10007148_04890 [Parvularcula lutaonensis]
MTVRTTWTGPKELLEQAELILTELIDPPVDAASLVRLDDASVEAADAPWGLHAYTEDPIPANALGMLPQELGPPVREDLEDRDWVAHALEGLGVVKSGCFVLFGSHDAEKASKMDGIKLQIEANRAFGTGHHPTTHACLDMLSDMAGLPVKKILDLGTGSGVLAIAARKLWPDAVIVATDIDEPSIPIAAENAEINDAPGIIWEVAEGTASAAIADNAPFDLVIANILAGPLIELAPDIRAVTADGGRVILAGLLDEQSDRVEAAYADQGLDLAEKRGTDRWPLLHLKEGRA